MSERRTSLPFQATARRVIDMPSTTAAATPSSSSVAPSTAPSSAARQDESKLIVGRNIRLKGEIAACDVLVVEGNVEASISCRLIEIAEHGVFNGKAEVETAEVHGRVEGELVAKKLLHVHASGKVNGRVRYGMLEVAPGGQLAGDISVLSDQQAAGVGTPRPQEVPGMGEQKRAAGE